jgi:hypothetical protein
MIPCGEPTNNANTSQPYEEEEEGNRERAFQSLSNMLHSILA